MDLYKKNGIKHIVPENVLLELLTFNPTLQMH